ncbi:MAG TPA: biotin/lipoyl-containing protein [Terriglobales bacterium]|nr:biotin/lipoyl-containing protein [Terriglobales bacterium]
MPFWYFVRVPELDPTVQHQSGTVDVVRYLLNEGDQVSPGTPLALVENYWALLRIAATGPGYVSKTFFRPGMTVKVGDPIAIVNADGEDLPYDKPSATIEVVERKRAKSNK